MKEKPREIIILHLRITNDDHMMYGSWDMEHETEFLVILGQFFTFYPTNNLKNQNLEKIKKHLQISSF